MGHDWKPGVLKTYCIAVIGCSALALSAGLACGYIVVSSGFLLSEFFLASALAYTAIAILMAYSGMALLLTRSMPFKTWGAASAILLSVSGYCIWRDGIDFGNAVLLFVYLAMPFAKRYLVDPQAEHASASM